MTTGPRVAKSKKSVSESMIFDAVQYIHLSWLKSNECLNVHCLNYIHRLSTSKVTKDKFRYVGAWVSRDRDRDLLVPNNNMWINRICEWCSHLLSSWPTHPQEISTTRPTSFNNERTWWWETHARTGRQKNMRTHLNSLVLLSK